MNTKLPALPLDGWRPTKDTIHLFSQILGKIRLALAPRRNHWWHVALRVSPRGLTTALVPSPKGDFEVELDLVRHAAWLRTSGGAEDRIPLRDGFSVADFHGWLFDRLRATSDAPPIRPVPYDLTESSEPFASDRVHAAHDPAAAERFASVLRWSERVLEQFASGFDGKASPVHFFWHAFDLAYTRFSGRSAPRQAGMNAVEREAYSQEVASFGFWPGDEEVPEPAFYAYAAPEPPGLAKEPLPKGARWRGKYGQALLRYEDVRTAPDPKAAVLEFYESVFRAATKRAKWPAVATAKGTPSTRPVKTAKKRTPARSGGRSRKR